jgi:hypothetical protein
VIIFARCPIIACEGVLAVARWREWFFRMGAGLLPRIVISAKLLALSPMKSTVAPLHAAHTHFPTDFRISETISYC